MSMVEEKAKTKNSFLPMLIIATLFFVFGFVTWLNGSLIPFLKLVCDLTESQALWVTFAFYIAYVVMALPMSWVLNRTGYKKGMVIGLAIMAAGALLFIPAAKSTLYGVFLLALFVLGTGLTILQTASNPYIVCIGPRETAAMRISIMGLVNKGAGVIVPLVFASVILTGMDQFSPDALEQLTEQQRAQNVAELSARLVVPYLYMAGALLVLMIFVWLSPLPEPELDEPVQHGGDAPVNRHSVLQFPQLVLGVIALFFYVGVEVIAGDTIGLYGQHLNVSYWGILTSYTMAFMVLGYIIGVTCIPKYLSQPAALQASAILGILLTVLIAYGSVESQLVSEYIYGWLNLLLGLISVPFVSLGVLQSDLFIPYLPDTVMYVALLGFANALVWPAIWPLALNGLGKFTATASAMLIMAIAGGALLPKVYGFIATSQGSPQQAYLMMLPCYLFIMYYAFKGHKVKSWK